MNLKVLRDLKSVNGDIRTDYSQGQSNYRMNTGKKGIEETIKDLEEIKKHLMTFLTK